MSIWLPGLRQSSRQVRCRLVVAIVGALTALWAATIAIAQSDIKKVLAYSTVSQLGYMFIAVGLGGVCRRHLPPHDSRLLQGAAVPRCRSVIHGMADEQDMDKMGGLLKKMPITRWTMGIATLAIAGIPPLAGFWSKDEILGHRIDHGGIGIVLWVVGLVTALITAFYMTRQWFMVFTGEPRWESGVTPHESPRSMTAPLVVLAALSLGAGFLNTPFRLTLEHFLEPSFELVEIAEAPEGLGTFVILALVSVLAGVAGMAMAAFVYRQPRTIWERFQGGFGRLWGVWQSAYRVDDLYGATLVAPGKEALRTDGVLCRREGDRRVCQRSRSSGAQPGLVRQGSADRIRTQLRRPVRSRTAGRSHLAHRVRRRRMNRRDASGGDSC